MKMIALVSSLAGENSNKPRRLNVALDILIEYLLKATNVDDIAGGNDSARKTTDLDQCNEALATSDVSHCIIEIPEDLCR